MSQVDYRERYLSEGYAIVSAGPVTKNTKIDIVCPLGHQYTSTPAKWQLGRRCRKCNKAPERMADKWSAILVHLNSTGFDVSYTSQGPNKRLVGQCPQGHAIDTSARGVYRGHQPCFQCSRATSGQTRFKQSEEKLIQTAEEAGYQLLASYEGQHGSMIFRCSNGHEYEVKRVLGFAQGQRCSVCGNNGTSKGELEVLEYVQSLGVPVNHKERDIIVNPQTGYPLELDIYVPGKLAIEFHGLYWHSSQAPDFRKGHSALKAKLCHEKNIQFLCIFSDEWESSKELIKAMVRYRLGLFNGTVLNARDLEVRTLKNKEVQTFFERNHLDGHRKCSFAVGLFSNGTLIQAASFGKTFVGFECLRMATDYDYRVKGGAARLFAQVEGPVVTYSNNRLSSGNVYQTLGFKEDTKTFAPSYWYTDGKVRIWRYSCRRINDPEILKQYPTEAAQAASGVLAERVLGKNTPLYRIEDCGHKRWIRL